MSRPLRTQEGRLFLMVRADRPVESWWTPGRVGYALHNYAELAVTLNDTPLLGGYEFAEAKADLDRAIDRLAPRLRRIADRYWRRDFDQSEIAREERLQERRTWYLIAEAQEEISEYLCKGVQ